MNWKPENKTSCYAENYGFHYQVFKLQTNIVYLDVAYGGEKWREVLHGSYLTMELARAAAESHNQMIEEAINEYDKKLQKGAKFMPDAAVQEVLLDGFNK